MRISKFLVLALSLVLASACGKKSNADKESEIYLIRHFQKQVATEQSGKDVSLTKEGRLNAKLLADHLQNKNIDSIYSTDYKRTIQTATPTSDLINLPISHYNPTELETFSLQLLASEKNQLVVGHSNTTGVLFGLLGCESIALTEKDYGDIMVVKRSHTQSGTTLLACSNYQLPAQAPVIADLLLLKQSNLHKYFEQTNTAFTINKVFQSESTDNGIVEVGFIIDENGYTTNYEIVKSSPVGKWHSQALNAAQQLNFLPSGYRLPTGKRVYTTWVFEFTAN